MKRRYVHYSLGVYSLVLRVKCNPPKRRRPLEAHFCHLRREEIAYVPGGRCALVLAGRFEKFATSPLRNRASINPRLLTQFPNSEENEAKIAEMIDWIVARDLKWSFDILGDRYTDVSGKHRIRTDPAFSFDDHRAAVEFKLLFG